MYLVLTCRRGIHMHACAVGMFVGGVWNWTTKIGTLRKSPAMHISLYASRLRCMFLAYSAYRAVDVVSRATQSRCCACIYTIDQVCTALIYYIILTENEWSPSVRDFRIPLRFLFCLSGPHSFQYVWVLKATNVLEKWRRVSVLDEVSGTVSLP